MLDRHTAFRLGRPLGLNQVTRLPDGRLSTWVENGYLCKVDYNVNFLPRRITATGAVIGTMTMDLAYVDGMFAGFAANSDLIPTLMLGEIVTLAGTPLGDLGGGSSLVIETAPALDLSTTAQAGSTGKVSDAGHRHKLPSAIQTATLSIPIAWNANTNTPPLASGVAPASATCYVCTVSGATVLDGLTFVKGDIAVFDPTGNTWAKIGADNRISTLWANRGTGDYHGQEKRFLDVGSGTQQGKYIGVWDSAKNKWAPAGGIQPYFIADPQTIASVANPAYNPANVLIHGGILGNTYGILCESLVDCANGGATARSVTYDYGATRFLSDTVNLNRRRGARCGFRNKAAASQFVFNKFDSVEVDWVGNLGSNTSSSAGSTMSEDSSTALSLARSWAFTGVTSALHVIRDNIWLIEG